MDVSDTTEAALDMRVTKVEEDPQGVVPASSNGNETHWNNKMLLLLSNRFLKQATFYWKFASYVINLDDKDSAFQPENKIDPKIINKALPLVINN